MADFAKLKRRTLPEPPSQDEASGNLAQPEHATIAAATSVPEQSVLVPRIDGRTLRRTNRILQFSTRVSPEFDKRLRDAAQRDGLMIVEVLERALDAYERARS